MPTPYEQWLLDDIAVRQADIALRKANADRVAAQDDTRNAEIKVIADAQQTAAGGLAYDDRRRELCSIVSDLIAKRVTASSVVSGAASSSKTSPTSLVADAVAIQAAIDLALPK